MLHMRVVGMKEALRKLHELSREVSQALQKGLLGAALTVEREVKRTIYAGHAQKHLEGDQGRLRQSITHEVDATQARVGTNVKYAPVHEFGATIKAKNHPYLVFRSRQVTETGVSKSGRIRTSSQLGGWVRVKQVTIPPRPFLGPALEAKRTEVGQQVEEAVREVLP